MRTIPGKCILGFSMVFFLWLQGGAQSAFSPDQAIRKAAQQYKLAVTHNQDSSRFPRSAKPNGLLRNVNSSDWCSGFFAGSLWLLYELTGDTTFKAPATKWTVLLEKEQFNKTTHDLGFMMYNSYGNAYRLTGNQAYKPVILQSAASLATRFKPAVGVIMSWDRIQWQYPVIIDNMMNLELLCEATLMSGNPAYKKIAVQHTDHDMQHHFRPDYSSYHVVDYDSLTGAPIKKQTHQGYSDESAWARGQSWGLYGFTMMFRYTKDDRYLQQAEGIAKFMLTHPNLPADKVPYWDFNDPAIPNAKRDASSASIMASALLELSGYVAPEKAGYYVQESRAILTSLGTDAYTAKVGTNNNFVLMHSVGNLPAGGERGDVDVPINYADYYYLEALLRYKNLSPALKK